jgi:mRNA interferase RelE/StbE
VLREDPHRGKSLQLTPKGLYSWRTGDWRIVYRLDRCRIEVVHATVGHRREVYTRVRSLLR